MKRPAHLIVALSLSVLLAPGTGLWAEDTSASQTPAQAQATSLTPDQLDTMVAPIALYPDQLLSQILVASTYPLELVQAQQWQQNHTDLKGEDLTKAAAEQNWDPSVQALVAFPEVLKRLNQDITWTTSLGNAFLAQQTQVMDAVQRMRAKAEDNGKLSSSSQQTVEKKTDDSGKQVIEIQPANPDVVYVPVYNPVWIWGPPAYYYYPAWYWPPAPPLGYWCVWGPAINVSFYFGGWHGWAGWGWHPWWGHRTVVVNNVFVTTNHFRAAPVTTVQGRSVWVHEPIHRMGVAYPTRALSQQFRAPVMQRVTVPQAQQQFHNSAVRFNTTRPVDRIGSHAIAPSVYNRNRSAFGGVETGTNARMHSHRGFSSMQQAPAAAGHSPQGKAGGVSHGGHGGHEGGGWGGGHGGEQSGGGGRR